MNSGKEQSHQVSDPSCFDFHTLVPSFYSAWFIVACLHTADIWDSPADGAGLFCGVLHYLLHLQGASGDESGTPKVLAATHFHEVFSNGLLDASLPISYVHMEAMLSNDSGELLDMDSATTGMKNGESSTHDNGDQGAGRIEIHYLYR
jgi:hypothetical protein